MVLTLMELIPTTSESVSMQIVTSALEEKEMANLKASR